MQYNKNKYTFTIFVIYVILNSCRRVWYTRLSEETELKPKPMVEIGGKPILWHIMKNRDNKGYMIRIFNKIKTRLIKIG